MFDFKIPSDLKVELTLRVVPDDDLKSVLQTVLQGLEALKMTVQELKAQVDASTTVMKSATDLINGLAAKIEAIKTDPAALQALADELRSESDPLAAAVAANTAAAGETP